AVRLNETNLLRLANAGEPGARAPLPTEILRPPGPRPSSITTPAPTNAAPRTNGPPQGGGRGPFSRMPFLMSEGAAFLVSPSDRGDGGAVFVESASMPFPSGRFTNIVTRSPWATN